MYLLPFFKLEKSPTLSAFFSSIYNIFVLFVLEYFCLTPLYSTSKNIPSWYIRKALNTQHLKFNFTEM